MSNQSVTYLVVACCAAFGLIAYVALILVPAWSAYSRLWERLAAAFLSLYSLLAFIGIGIGIGLAVFWFWTEITP